MIRPPAPSRILPLLPALLLAAAVPSCSSPPELEGAAAARSRGALVEAAGEERGAPASPAAAVDPWLNDTREMAFVNGSVITLREVRHAMGPAYEQYLDRREELAAFVNARVKDLVLRRLVIEEGKRIGFASSDEDLERETERAERKAAEAGSTLEQTLRDLGMTRREWDDRTRDDILYQRALFYFTGQFPDRFYAEDRYRPAVDFYVSPGEIRAYGARHGAELGVLRPAEATLRFIDLRVDAFRGAGVTDAEAWRRCERAMDGAEERIRDGESFADVAKAVSMGPEAPRGGLAGPFRRDSPLREEFLAWAFREGRKDGDLSPRFRLPSGLVLVRMERLEPERTSPIEEWAPAVRARLVDLKRTVAWNDVQIDLLEEASVSPPEVRALLLNQLRANNRRLRDDLEGIAETAGSR